MFNIPKITEAASGDQHTRCLNYLKPWQSCGEDYTNLDPDAAGWGVCLTAAWTSSYDLGLLWTSLENIS